ncbi:VWA domain-containing protein, partial [Candidatus Woesearchaeota archaeon]|nr:VWA domain-containing protein [Candidatus Woesearchaeota archaeon]
MVTGSRPSNNNEPDEPGTAKDYSDSAVKVKSYSTIEEFAGKLEINLDRGLMRSVVENDKSTIDSGKLIADSINQGLSSFTVSSVFEQLVKNFSLAKSLFGSSVIRLLTGYEDEFVGRNIALPEFQKDILKRLEEKIESLRQEGLIDGDGAITERAVELASLILYTEELDKIAPRGSEGRVQKTADHYGIKDETNRFRKERYRDIDLRKSVRKAVMRSHSTLLPDDLMSFRRKGKGRMNVIYGLDASGSMRGGKLEAAKKAGIALAYKAIDEKDEAGLVVFSSGIKAAVAPTHDFTWLLKEIARARASGQTGIAGTIRAAANLFPKTAASRHIVLITDAMPTRGANPEQETVEAAATAAAEGITISLAGINLDDTGIRVAGRIAEAGKGKLYAVKDL